MSVFTGEQTTATDTDQATEDNSNQDYVKTLVEAKGETWQDPQAIAKGYLSAQEYIAQLEAQTKELKEDLTKQDYAKTLLEQLQEKGANPQANSVVKEDTGQENTTPKFSEDELKSLVNATLEERTAEEKASKNLQAVDSKLSELFGDKANSVVEAKGKELGLSKDRMKELAAESPEAFIRLVGDVQSRKDNSVPSSQLNTNADSFNTTSKRDFSYYQKIRKENPKSYYSNSVQQQMMQDRMKLGQDFYN